jgi:hypothetical protein
MRSKSFLSLLFGMFACLALPAAQAQSPFAGTWKMNQDLSQLAGDTMQFIPAQGDALEMTAGGITYSFRTDGKTYGTPSGNIAIWRQTTPTSWTTEYRTIENKLLYSDDWKLSPDGKTLSLIISGAHPNGDLYTNNVTYKRTSGASGLLGTWKSTEVKLSSPNSFSIEASGLDAMMFRIPALKATCRATLDGKDAAVDGPDVPTGLRISLTRSGPYSLQMVQKLNGSVIQTSQYTVSEDGKTLTEVGGAPGDPPSTTVWEKQ